MHLNHKSLFLLIGLSLATLSALLRFWALDQTPYANGWDSYFYLVQLKSLEETGQMHSPEASLIYPYLQLFYWLTGDYVRGMKTGVAVLCGLWVAVVYGSTAFRASGSAPLRALVTNEKGINAFFPDSLKAVLPALIALFSPHLTYFAAQYPKNLLGLIFFGLFVNSLQRPVAGRYGWLLPAFCLIINYFGHRMTFGLAVVYLVLHLLFQFQWATFTKLFKFSKRVVPDSERPAFSTGTLKKIMFYGAIAVGLFLLAGQFFPGLANMADSGRLQGVISAAPQFAPRSFVQTFGFQRISAWWLFEIIAITVLFLWALFQALRRHDRERLPLLMVCALLIFPFLEWSTTGIAWRFWMVFVLLIPLASPKSLASAKSAVRSPKSEVGSVKPAFSGWKISVRAAGICLCGAALFVAAFFSWKSYQPALHDPDYAQFQKMTERTQVYFEGQPAPELVIAHNALAEYFTFTTGIDAMPWLPEYEIDSFRLWRIAAGVHQPTLQYFSGKEHAGHIKSLGGNYYLLPEFVWRQALVRAHSEQDELFLEVAESWRNPWKMRPGWLLRKVKPAPTPTIY